MFQLSFLDCSVTKAAERKVNGKLWIPAGTSTMYWSRGSSLSVTAKQDLQKKICSGNSIAYPVPASISNLKDDSALIQII